MRCDTNKERELIEENRKLRTLVDELRRTVLELSQTCSRQDDEIGYYSAYSAFLTMMAAFYRDGQDHPEYFKYIDEILKLQGQIVSILVDKEMPARPKFEAVHRLVYEGRGKELTDIYRTEMKTRINEMAENKEQESDGRDAI